MTRKIVYIALVVFVLLGSSCSKVDESIEPTSNGYATQSTWVNYSLSPEDASIPYDIQYISDKGLQTIYNYTGNFTARVPVQKFDSAGTTYARTLLSIKTRGSDAQVAPSINAEMKIASDYGFIIAEVYHNSTDCGFTERKIAEVRPLSWFNIK